MAGYIPKSKVNILETAGAEFMTAVTKEIYVGTYMELSDGTFFIGNNPQNLGESLLRLTARNYSFKRTKNNVKYRGLKTPTYTELSKKKNIPIIKPDPLLEDYKRGYFMRYFSRRVNDAFNYFEINKKTYEDLKSKNPKYDYNLHIIGKINWALLETSNKLVANINESNINLLLNQYPNLNVLFNNFADYEPFHTRNFKEKFYINTGSEYITYTGYFHGHPTNGSIMEGPFHSTKPHRKLLIQDQINKMGKSREKTYIPSSNPGTTSMGPIKRGSSTSPGGSTSSRGSTSSGGGGY